MRTGMLTACVCAAALACGGTRDPLTGQWRGTTVVALASGDPLPASLDGVVPQGETDVGVYVNSVSLCVGPGVPTTSTGPTSFTVQSYTCAPGGTHRDVTVDIVGGGGAASGTELHLRVDYMVTAGDGQTYQLSSTFVGTRWCAGSGCPSTLVGG